MTAPSHAALDTTQALPLATMQGITTDFTSGQRRHSGVMTDDDCSWDFVVIQWDFKVIQWDVIVIHRYFMVI